MFYANVYKFSYLYEIIEKYISLFITDLCFMQHKGEIIEKAVRLSGFPITKLAKRIGKTPRWVYYLFESKDVALDYILKIGEIIHYDFSAEIKELQRYKNEVSLKYDLENQSSEIEYWKNKYLEILEKYNQLLETNISTKK